jgi:peptidoglycan pentaglycine glycine transferase (the first glycine)
MKLRLELISQKQMWEKFLLSYSPESLFQTWQWGEVQEKSGQPIQRYGIYDGKNLIGIAQLTVVRAKRGTFLHVRHGPIWKSQSKAHWREFIRLVKELAKKERAWFVRISPLLSNTTEHMTLMKELGLTPAPIHEVDAERCWVLGLDKTEDELMMEMRKTTRYEIRLAQKSDVTVNVSTNPKDLVHFFKLYEETSKRHGFVAHSSIAEEFEVFGAENKALLFLGYAGRDLIAGTMVLFYGGQAIYHHGASIASKVPVSYLVQWEAIKEAKKRGIKLYNFYGIAPEDKPNHPWRGITLFKKGFGGREINYIHAHDLPTSPLYPIPWAIETIRRKRRGY